MKLFTLSAVVAGTTLLGLATSCERPADRTDDHGAVAPSEAAAERRPGLGEGEREGALTNAEIVDRFAREIKNDPTISQASNASLLLTVNGELVLQGTATSDDVKDELEDYAEKLAGREIRNEIEVADK